MNFLGKNKDGKEKNSDKDDEDGDTIYAIDRISEEVLIAFFADNIAPITPIRLIAEGLSATATTVPWLVDLNAAYVEKL